MSHPARRTVNATQGERPGKEEGKGMSDLVGLARRYVQLSDELASVRGEIAKAVLNGGVAANLSALRQRGDPAERGRSRSIQMRFWLSKPSRESSSF